MVVTVLEWSRAETMNRLSVNGRENKCREAASQPQVEYPRQRYVLVDHG
jgi:hypothetical protein